MTTALWLAVCLIVAVVAYCVGALSTTSPVPIAEERTRAVPRPRRESRVTPEPTSVSVPHAQASAPPASGPRETVIPPLVRGACGVLGCPNPRSHSHVEDLVRRMRERV